MPTLKQKMQKLTGYCSHCGTEIIDLTKRKRARMLPNYREHEIQLSDGSLMRVGVCDTCKAKLVAGPDVQKTADKIVANHKIYWDANIQDRPDHSKKYKNLTCIDPNSDINKVKIQRKKRKDEEALARQLDDERREKDRAREEKQKAKGEEAERKRLEKVEEAKAAKIARAKAKAAEMKAAHDQFEKDFAAQEKENRRIEQLEREGKIR